MKFKLVSILVAVACAFSAFTVSAEDWRKKYPKVTLGIASGENQQDTILRWQPGVEYLSNQLGIEVVLRTASDYAGIIEAMAAEKVEFGWIGGAGYAVAYDIMDGNVEPLVMDVSSKGKLGYHSMIIVKGDASYGSLADLKGKSLAFTDPNSTSGYTIPSTVLSKEGYLDKNKPFFSRTGFSGSHENGVMAVLNGTYDAAVTWAYDKTEGNHTRMAKKGMIKPNDIKIIWWSPLIPNSPFCAIKSLPEGLKQGFKNAMLNFEKNDPVRFNKVIDKMMGGFAPTNAEMYQYAIDIRALKKKERN
jgi:phosphonate transport system substrate-binding protein